MQPSRTFIIAIIVSIGALSVAAVAISKDDRSQLQGRWERSLVGDADSHGAAKAVKEIAGNRETVTYLNDAGKTVYATTADFKLEADGRIKLYTVSKVKAMKGSDQDLSRQAMSYVYRLEGDQYHEVHGLLADSTTDSKPSLVTWKRVN